MIDKLCTGQTVVIADAIYRVTGAAKRRGQLCYLLRDAKGGQHALEQKRLLEGQRDQWLQVKF